MGKPDVLSQRPDHPQGTNDNLNITPLAPEKFHIRAAQNPAGALLSTLNKTLSAEYGDVGTLKIQW